MICPENTTLDPAVFAVIDQGRKHAPLTEEDLLPWYSSPVDLLFDTTRNEVRVRREEGAHPDLIELGPHRQRKMLSSILEILRVIAEHPGVRLTRSVLNQYTHRGIGEDKTLTKYIERLRELLGDGPVASSLVLTDRGVDTSVHRTGSAYYGNPDRRWRVIRYIRELSSGFPLPRPSAPLE